MNEEIAAWFQERGYVGTTAFRDTKLALLTCMKHGREGLYQNLSKETGKSYTAISRSVGRGTEKIWEGEKIFSKLDPKPTLICILEELLVMFQDGQKKR